MSSAVNDGSRRQQQRHRSRFAPYSTTQEPWSMRIADAVHKALQRGPETRQSAAPILRKRRLLATKMQLAAQSVVNMVTYLERHERQFALARAPSGDRCAPPRGYGISICESEAEEAEEAEVVDNEQDTECSMCCICLEKNQPNDARDPVQVLPCGHVFHRDCISQWMSYRRCCPVDRIEVADDA